MCLFSRVADKLPTRNRIWILTVDALSRRCGPPSSSTPTKDSGGAGSSAKARAVHGSLVQTAKTCATESSVESAQTDAFGNKMLSGGSMCSKRGVDGGIGRRSDPMCCKEATCSAKSRHIGADIYS